MFFWKSGNWFLFCFFIIQSVSPACGQNPQKVLWLDKKYSSYCEAFEEIGKFAISLHVEKTKADFSQIRKQAILLLGNSLKISSPIPEPNQCQDIEFLFKEYHSKNSKITLFEMYQKSLKVLALTLDPHSRYFTPQEQEEFQEKQVVNENYGVGIIFQKKITDPFELPEKLVVEEVIPNTPAQRKGIQAGDKIIEINGKSLKNFTSSLLSTELSNPNPLTLKVEEQEEIFSLEKVNFPIPSLMVQVQETPQGKIGYLKIRSFNKGISKEVKEAILSLGKNSSPKGLLLDLRGNGGGFVKEAVEVADLFLDKGPALATRGNPRRKIFPTWLNPNQSYVLQPSQITSLPIVVLIDSGSASASEILAGLLKRSGRAFLLGDRTYGKGTGQLQIPLSMKNGFGGLLVLTMFRYYLADNFCPQRVGVIPHVQFQDPTLQAVIEKRKKENLLTPLREGENPTQSNVVSSLPFPHREIFSQTIAQTLQEIRSHFSKNEVQAFCSSQKDLDCQRAISEKVLAFLYEKNPEWPLVSFLHELD